MDVQMPDGTTIQGVPDGITKSQLMEKYGKLQNTDLPQEQIAQAPNPQQNDSFFSEMGSNFQHGIQSAQDLFSGNYQDIGRVQPTPKTQSLVDKVFPPGYQGGVLEAFGNAGNTVPSDWSGALLEKMGETQEGKALAAMGGINPVWNAASTAVNRYVNPTIADVSRQTPQTSAGTAIRMGLNTVFPGAEALSSYLPKEGIAPDNLSLLEAGASALGLKQAAKTPDPLISMVRKGLSPKIPIPTAAELRDTASQSYQAAEAQGGVLKPHITDNWINKASQALPQTQAGKAVLGESATAKLVERLQGLRGQPLTLQAAMEIFSGLGDAMESHVDPKTGKLLSEGNKILGIQNALWDSIENASASDIQGGKAGFDTWKQGKTEWAKSMRMNEIERIIKRSEGADNPATVLKNGFRALKSNPSHLRGFSAEERAAINQAARTGIVGGALKFMGSRLISSTAGTIAGAAGGGMPGAMLGAVGGAAIGTPMRMGAEALQMRRATKVQNAVARSGGPPKPKVNLPALPSKQQVGKQIQGSAMRGAIPIDQRRKVKQ